MNLSRDAIPLPTLQPPAVFPKPLYPCLPVREDEEQDALLEIKKDLLTAFRVSRFADNLNPTVRQIQRYSDRYSQTNSQVNSGSWDMRLFPSELQDRPTAKKKRKTKKKSDAAGGDALSKLPADEGEEKSGDESGDEAADAGEEEEVAEEVGEEETDYALTYFDNGEDYLEADHDDDGDEGPTY